VNEAFEGIVHSSPKRGRMARGIVIVLDSGGIGALGDAAVYGDAPGANTIGNTAQSVGGLTLPNFERLGLGCLTAIRGVGPVPEPAAFVGKLDEASKGKDTITGHWEMAGIHTEVPFPTYPLGFPPEIIEAFAAICGREPLGNVAASGTEIIERLGPEHLSTGRPILYTSADSVFQVAAHEDVVPLDVLYDWCVRARAMLVSPNEVNRVIARPFVGRPGHFERTANRRDFALDPPENVLDRMAAADVEVHAVGKICDIFNGRSIASSVRVSDNEEAMERTFDILQSIERGFVFVNLNDFDSKYGHRRDVRGYAAALERLDTRIPALEAALRPGDVAVFTADHGCDPTAPGSDHTREYLPYVELGARRGLATTTEGLDVVGRRMSELLVAKETAGRPAP
jgi:phosphopentomutase